MYWLLPGLAVELRLKPSTAIHRIHEQVSNGNGNIKVREACLVILRVNKTQNVRMRNTQDAHVRTAPDAALLNDLGRLVDDVHETDRTTRDASCRIHH